ncbi:MAG TPA: hypothetical protein VK168_01885 [Saprospiraceae bacterium]|nr:hypothetical protein [Saprospiraceae bacterium]
MTSTFVIDVIQTLTTEELKSFRTFLESPYFNHGTYAESVVPFFDTLQKSIQNHQIEQLGKEDVHQLLFPGKPFIESKIDKIMSETKRLLERFLVSEKYHAESNQQNQQLDLAIELRMRGLEHRYMQTMEKVRKMTATNHLFFEDALLLKYKLEREEQEWQAIYHKYKGDINIPNTIDALEYFYYFQKTWMLSHWLLLKKSAQTDGSPETRAENWHVPNEILAQSPFLDICWDIFQLYRSSSVPPESFYGLLAKIQLNEHNIQPKTLALLYGFLRNLCVLIVDSGEISIYPIFFEINKDNLSRGYFYKNGKLIPNSCLNITTVAINAGEIAWATEFVEAHKERIIDENESQDFYRMNKAICLFGNKKFQEALDIIPFGSTYSYYHLMARRLELKIYYELHSDLLDHKIDAFKMFISRAGKKVFSPQIHELFSNFVNFVRQLSQSHGPQARQRSEVLIKRISEKKVVAERMWLLEKARELGNKKA